MPGGAAHRLFLSLREIFTRSTECPDCGAASLDPCVGIGDVFNGATLHFHHLGRIVASHPEWIDQLPFIP